MKQTTASNSYYSPRMKNREPLDALIEDSLFSLGYSRKQQNVMWLCLIAAAAFWWVLMPMPAHAAFFQVAQDFLSNTFTRLSLVIVLIFDSFRAIVVISFLSNLLKAYNSYGQGDSVGQLFSEAFRLPILLTLADLMIETFIV